MLEFEDLMRLKDLGNGVVKGLSKAPETGKGKESESVERKKPKIEIVEKDKFEELKRVVYRLVYDEQVARKSVEFNGDRKTIFIELNNVMADMVELFERNGYDIYKVGRYGSLGSIIAGVTRRGSAVATPRRHYTEQPSPPVKVGIGKYNIRTKKFSSSVQLKVFDVYGFLQDRVSAEKDIWQGTYSTILPFDGRRRTGEYLFEENLYIPYLLDIDFKGNPDKLAEWKEKHYKKLLYVLLKFGGKFAIRISRSGQGLHIILFISTGRKGVNGKFNDREGEKFLRMILKDEVAEVVGADKSVFDDARVMFQSPYPWFVFNYSKKHVIVDITTAVLKFKGIAMEAESIPTDKQVKLKEFKKKYYNGREEYWQIRKDRFENEEFSDFVRNVMKLPGHEVRKIYGKGRQLFETAMKFLAKEVGKRKIREASKVYYDKAVLYSTDKTPWLNIGISPNEKSPYDIFTYNNNTLIFFQSENALRHLADPLKVHVAVGKSGKPFLKEYVIGELFFNIAMNYGIKLPKGFSEVFMRKAGLQYTGAYVSRRIAMAFLNMLSRAVCKPPEKGRDLDKDTVAFVLPYNIPEDLRKGVNYKLYHSIKSYMEEFYGRFVKFDKGKRNVDIMIVNRKEILKDLERIKKVCYRIITQSDKNESFLGLLMFLVALMRPDYIGYKSYEEFIDKVMEEFEIFKLLKDVIERLGKDYFVASAVLWNYKSMLEDEEDVAYNLMSWITGYVMWRRFVRQFTNLESYFEN